MPPDNRRLKIQGANLPGGQTHPVEAHDQKFIRVSVLRSLHLQVFAYSPSSPSSASRAERPLLSLQGKPAHLNGRSLCQSILRGNRWSHEFSSNSVTSFATK